MHMLAQQSGQGTCRPVVRILYSSSPKRKTAPLSRSPCIFRTFHHARPPHYCCQDRVFEFFSHSSRHSTTNYLSGRTHHNQSLAYPSRSLLSLPSPSTAPMPPPRRPDTFVKAKTVFALTPDTTGLDMDAPPKSHDR